MKKIKKFDNFLNEISRELVDRASDAMIDRGQSKRARNLVTDYNNVNYNFDKFIGRELFGETINSIRIIDYGDDFTRYDREENHLANKVENERLEIYLSNNEQYNRSSSTLHYDILNDKFLYLPNNISRKDVRLLGKIAQVVNTDTKYLKGTGDIKVIGY
jgi:predicted RNA-binding protein YlqC (UPF0109 family)